ISEATDVTIVDNGNVLVTDANNRVEVFSEGGTFIRQFGSSGTADGQFTHPAAIDVDDAGHVWVLDQGNGRVEGFTEGGKFLGKFSSKGTATNQLSPGTSGGLANDDEGHLWIADTNNNRLVRWQDSSGLEWLSATYQSTTGSKGTADGQLRSPTDLALGSEGNVWAADHENNRVEKFAPDGTFLSKFGTAGGADGSFSSPSGITVDSQGN